MKTKSRRKVLFVVICLLLLSGCGSTSSDSKQQDSALIDGGMESGESEEAPEQISTVKEISEEAKDSEIENIGRDEEAAKEPVGDLDEAYRELLLSYMTAIEEKWDYERCVSEQLCPVNNSEDMTADKLEYALEDLNHDKQEEFLIFGNKTKDGSYYYDNYVCGLYTISNHELMPIFVNWYGPREDGWYIYEDGLLYLKLGGTGVSLCSWARLGEDNKLHAEACYGAEYPPREDPNYFYSDKDEAIGVWFDDEENLYTEIDESKYEEYEKEYGRKVVADLNKYKLSDYLEINGLNQNVEE